MADFGKLYAIATGGYWQDDSGTLGNAVTVSTLGWWNAFGVDATAYAVVTKGSSTWVVYDADADTLNGDMDWDGTGMIKRRFDEPEEAWSEVPKGDATWSDT